MRVKGLAGTEWGPAEGVALPRLPRAGVSLALTVGAVLLWLWALPGVNVRAMNDLGLVSVLPASLLVAPLLVMLGFLLALGGRQLRVPLLLLQVVTLVFMLYGLPALVEDAPPRTATAWKLLGIVGFIQEYGAVDARIDAFFNWPGFFILTAFLTELTGLASARLFATWAHVFFNLLYLGPLLLLFRTSTREPRLVWLAVWFFLLGNWIGQDYLAPQAFSYFLYLTILAVLLTWFRQPLGVLLSTVGTHGGRLGRALVARLEPRAGRGEALALPSQPWQRVGLMALIIALYAVVVPSHQLTPFAILGAVVALLVFTRITPRTLPLVMLVLVGLWLSYMAVPYLSGHIRHVAAPVGDLGANVDANLTGRFRGSDQHRFILYLRTAASLAFWGLAFLGGLRRLRAGRTDLHLALLALAPFALILLQSYGGELLLRVYFFSLPFMAFFVAALCLPSRASGRTWATTGRAALLSALLLISFFFTRYGNERMDFYTAQEAEAVRYLYTTAEPGSHLLAVRDDLPWRYQGYRSYRYEIISDYARDADIEGLIHLMQNPRFPNAYLILSRSQRASAELFTDWPPGTWETFEQALASSGQFTVIFANEDAQILTLTSNE